MVLRACELSCGLCKLPPPPSRLRASPPPPAPAPPPPPCADIGGHEFPPEVCYGLMIGHHCKLSPLVRRGCRKTCGLCKPTMSPSPSPSASPSPSPSPSPAPLSGWLEPRPGRKQLRLQVTLGLDMGEHREVARAVELALRDALGLPWHNLRATVVKIRAGSLLVVFDISTDDQDEPTDETPLGAALRLACMLASLEAGQGGLLDATEVGRSVVAAAGVQRVHADGTLRQLVCQQPESACFDAGALDFPAEACRGLAVDHHCVLSPLVLRACSQSCELCAAMKEGCLPPDQILCLTHDACISALCVCPKVHYTGACYCHEIK